MLNNIAVQLNPINKECAADMDGTFKKLRGLGFRGVEFCGFHGKSAKEILELTKKYNLAIVASHIDVLELLDEYDDVVAYHKELGCKRIVITYGDIHGLESLSMLMNDLNSLEHRLETQGIELLYHNHEREFKKFVTGEIALTSIMNNTRLKLELDAFWAEQAGVDVMELIEKYKERIPLIHIKDGSNHIPSAIGYGTATVKPIYDYCVNNHLEWIIVELSSKMENPMQELAKSVDYINKNF